MKTHRPIVLVIGATGQVGWELMRALAPIGQLAGAALEAGAGLPVDLSRPETLAGLMAQTRPDLIVNAAAYTAVDKAESEPELAALVNAEAVGELGRLAAAADIPLIHYSTDFVFDGQASRPYRETDEATPLSVYGRTKLEGEQQLAASGASFVVLRTSWVYGVRGSNFLRTMRRLFHERDELSVVDDQVGAPTWSRLLAEATALIAWRFLHGGGDPRALQGVYHLTSAGETSWHGFACAILNRSGLACRLKQIPTSHYPAPAVRPSYSVLDNSKIGDAFGIALPDWRYSLERCLDDLNV